MDSTVANVVMPELSFFAAVARLFCAMLVGIVVGVERGRNHRPAGMRTHMLVAMGACAVMVTSQMLFVEFRPLGATPDPARLGAQVISGVGFLGAGTIMREGNSVKGLTTAASVWVVACLGLAAGAGYYAFALAGAALVYLTLTVFEVLQRKLNVGRHATLLLAIDCVDLTGVLRDLNRFAVQQNALISHVQFDEKGDGTYRLSATAVFNGAPVDVDEAVFLEKISANTDVRHLETTHY